MSKTKFWSSYETLNSIGDKKLMMKFYLCFSQFLWTLKFTFLNSHGKLFSVLFHGIIYTLGARKLFWYNVFVQFKLKLLDLLSDFVLKHLPFGRLNHRMKDLVGLKVFDLPLATPTWDEVSLGGVWILWGAWLLPKPLHCHHLKTLR